MSTDPEWEEFLGRPTKPSFGRSNLNRRFQKLEQKSKQQKQRLLQQQEEKISQICTFAPQVKTGQKKRSLAQFLKQQETFQKQKAERLQRLREAKEEAEISELKSVNQKVKKKQGDSVFEKLYNYSKTPSQSVISQVSEFVPSINKSKLQRDQPIQITLYNDALRRRNKQVVQKQTPEFSMSTSSQKVLIEKLARQYIDVFQEFDQENYGCVNYNGFIGVLETMGFIKNDPEDGKYQQQRNLLLKTWDLIVPVNRESVIQQNLLLFLLSVMNLHPGFANSHNSSTLSSLGNLLDQEFQVTQQQAKRINRTFKLFYQNRNAFLHSNKKFKQNHDYSFKPQVLKTSQKLAQHRKQKKIQQYGTSSTQEIYMKQKRKKQERLAKEKQDKEKKELESCTFRPQINRKHESKPSEGSKRYLALYNLAQDKQKKEAPQPIQPGISECTFTPKLFRPPTAPSSSGPKGVEKVIERMRKAREEQELKQSMKLRHSASQAGMKCGIQTSHKSISTFTPKQPRQQPMIGLQESQSNKEILSLKVPESFKPITTNSKAEALLQKMREELEDGESESSEQELTVNVKLPNGKFEDLVILPGQNKEQAVDNFVRRYGLTGDQAIKLKAGVLSSLM